MVILVAAAGEQKERRSYEEKKKKLLAKEKRRLTKGQSYQTGFWCHWVSFVEPWSWSTREQRENEKRGGGKSQRT